MELSQRDRHLCFHLEGRAEANPIANQMQTDHRSHLFMLTLLNTTLLWVTSLEM